MRIALGVEYDGTSFCGWQVQQGVRTVQACVEQALSRVADHRVQVSCAGRTDAGVHATGQVVHFDTVARRSMRSWVLGTNVNLPRDVCVQWAVPVSEAFHARFSARTRRYHYLIATRTARPALKCSRVWWVHRSLNEKRMASATTYLKGEHDFSSFRALACQAKDPVRTVKRLDVSRHGKYFLIDIEANGFLHHMVRNIVGVLIAVGSGEQPPEWVRDVLAARDRRAGAVTAPAQGLYLVAVSYPEQFGLPEPEPEFGFFL
jgi:pseudouridylate synthase I